MIHLAEKHRAETAIAHRARFGELVGGFFEPEFHGRRRGNSAGDEVSSEATAERTEFDSRRTINEYPIPHWAQSCRAKGNRVPANARNRKSRKDD